jgi:ABC-type branched-subunit amino acid transport system ATPase component
MNPATDILVAEGVGKQFGGFVALKDVSVRFARDKLSAIIGPNGAGKSTFFNVISRRPAGAYASRATTLRGSRPTNTRGAASPNRFRSRTCFHS